MVPFVFDPGLIGPNSSAYFEAELNGVHRTNTHFALKVVLWS